MTFTRKQLLLNNYKARLIAPIAHVPLNFHLIHKMNAYLKQTIIKHFYYMQSFYALCGFLFF